MKIDLATTARVYVNAGKVLTEAELAKFTDGNTTSQGVSVASSEVLDIVCDLVSPYLLSAVNYYRQQGTSESVVLYGRQSPQTPWVVLTTTSVGQNISADLNNSENKYRFIRVVHTVISGTAAVYELEIFTKEDLEFENNADTVAIDSGTSTNSVEAITITNTDIEQQDFFCLLDPGDYADLLSLSMAESGPFYSIYEAGVSLPTNFSFSAGAFSQTQVISNTVRLLPAFTSGVYYTPVIDTQGLEGRRIFWKATLSGTNTIDGTSSTDSEPTIGLRFSNTPPSDIGWASGQLSTDGRWSVVSGTLSFDPYANHQILEPFYPRYLQAKIEFTSPAAGSTPVLESVGIETGIKLTIGAHSTSNIYIRSSALDHANGRESGLLVWFYQYRS